MPSRPGRAGLRRLKTRPDFLKIAGARRKWAARGLVLQTRRRDAGLGDEPRVGFTVSRKVGGAVTRNRARRRLRAAAEAVLPVYALPDHDYVLIGRKGTIARPFAALLGDLEAALKRVDAYRRAPEETDS